MCVTKHMELFCIQSFKRMGCFINHNKHTSKLIGTTGDYTGSSPGLATAPRGEMNALVAGATAVTGPP